MKLHAKRIPYSSIVGGGLTLIDDSGRHAFIVNFIGTTKGITKEETAALADQFAKWIEEHGGIEVPDREASS